MTNAPAPVLVAERLTKDFVSRRGPWLRRCEAVVHAVQDVSFSLHRGEVLGIVGESGSGKTTVARMLLRLIEPTSGTVHLDGINVTALTARDVRQRVRPKIRMVFQDPDAALNPGYTVGFGLERAMRIHAAADDARDIPDRVRSLLQRVGLDESFVDKYPDELSGGEKRRVGICRALATDPLVIVADEPLSGLDVVLQERVLSLIRAEQETRQFALVLVSHDLDRVHQVCDRVLVMHGGRVVEEARIHREGGITHEQYHHPYSRLLQASRIDTTTGQHSSVDPSPAEVSAMPRGVNGAGCSFAPSCRTRVELGDRDRCWREVPLLLERKASRLVACHFADEAISSSALRMKAVEVS